MNQFLRKYFVNTTWSNYVMKINLNKKIIIYKYISLCTLLCNCLLLYPTEQANMALHVIHVQAVHTDSDQ